MEFWGVEVKAGEAFKVSPGEGKLIHLSQASIGESKKGNNESVPVYVKVDGQKLVLGTLSGERCPQIQYDIVFEKDFELSHNWKNGSIFFCGYKTQNPVDDEVYSGDDFESDSEEEELALENGNPEPAKAVAPKPVSAAKPKVKVEETVKDVNADSDEDSSDEDDDSSDSDDDLLGDSDDEMEADDDSDGEGDSSDEDEKTPTPKKETKKRPTETESKTPVPSKKAKFATPQKKDGKKVAAAAVTHVATPHPAKQAAKTPKSDAKTPASAGKVSCGTCSKTFNSGKALESHSKAKHAVK